MDNLKKVILIIVFVIIISISSIMAYMTASDSSTNTFIIGDIAYEETDFVLKEHKVLDEDGDGKYELSTDEVISNTYKVFPGVDIPKDPFIRIKDLKYSAYLYVEVVGESNDDFSWSVNDKWVKLDKEGLNGGYVYAYKGDSSSVVSLNTETGKDFTTNILAGIDGSPNGGIVISDNYSKSEGVELSFYGYLIQSGGFKDYIEAYDSI